MPNGRTSIVAADLLPDMGPGDGAIPDLGALPGSIAAPAGQPGGSQRVAPGDADRYFLKRLLAEGGLGQVWLAYDRALQRDVALKQVRAKWNLKPKIVEQFQLEAIITGRLEHPGIVPVHDVGRDADGQLFYCMKLVQGSTLREEIHSWRRLPSGPERDDRRRRVLGAFLAVCDALAFAHSRGVLHLDLKPENIILGEYGETLILDWGLAKLLAGAEDPSSDRRIKGAVGTPRYMAPEQIAGAEQSLSPATDIYALGMILAEIALADLDLDLPALDAQRLDQAPAAALVSFRRLAGPIRSICRVAAAIEPSERYQDARDLALDVQRWQAGERVAVHPDGPIAKFRRFAKRRKTLVTTVAVAGIVLAGWWFDRRLSAQVDAQAALVALRQARADWLDGRRDPAILLATSAADRLGNHASLRLEADRARRLAQSLQAWRGFSQSIERARLVSIDPSLAAEAKKHLEQARSLAKVELPREYQNELVAQERAADLAEVELLERYLATGSATSEPSATQGNGGGPGVESQGYLIGRARQLAGDHTGAAAAFEACLARRPDDYWAMYFLAACRERLGQPTRALAAYTACLARQPRAAYLYLNRGNVYKALEQPELALADYQRAERLAESDPKPYFNRGLIFLGSGAFESALAEFERALAIDPQNVDILLQQARAQRALDRSDQALATLDRVLALAPGRADAASEKAFLLWHLGDAPGAVAAADRASQLDPKSPAAPWIRALVHAGREDWANADMDYRAALALDPENATLLNNHADTLLALGQSAAALGLLDKALALQPDYPLARYNRVRALLDLNRHEDALAELEALSEPESEEEALGDARRLAATALRAGQRPTLPAARRIIAACFARIARMDQRFGKPFRDRALGVPAIETLARNPQTRLRMFPDS